MNPRAKISRIRLSGVAVTTLALQCLFMILTRIDNAESHGISTRVITKRHSDSDSTAAATASAVASAAAESGDDPGAAAAAAASASELSGESSSSSAAAAAGAAAGAAVAPADPSSPGLSAPASASASASATAKAVASAVSRATASALSSSRGGGGGGGSASASASASGSRSDLESTDQKAPKEDEISDYEDEGGKPANTKKEHKSDDEDQEHSASSTTTARPSSSKAASSTTRRPRGSSRSEDLGEPQTSDDEDEANEVTKTSTRKPKRQDKKSKRGKKNTKHQEDSEDKEAATSGADDKDVEPKGSSRFFDIFGSSANARVLGPGGSAKGTSSPSVLKPLFSLKVKDEKSKEAVKKAGGNIDIHGDAKFDLGGGFLPHLPISSKGSLTIDADTSLLEKAIGRIMEEIRTKGRSSGGLKANSSGILESLFNPKSGQLKPLEFKTKADLQEKQKIMRDVWDTMQELNKSNSSATTTTTTTSTTTTTTTTTTTPRPRAFEKNRWSNSSSSSSSSSSTSNNSNFTSSGDSEKWIYRKDDGVLSAEPEVLDVPGRESAKGPCRRPAHPCDYKNMRDSDRLLAVVLTKRGGFRGRRLSEKAIQQVMAASVGSAKNLGDLKVSKNNSFVLPAGTYYFPRAVRVVGFDIPPVAHHP